ncbi:MAG: hypothetical protein JW797_05365 [Bradymonadales bacterium]|nr:hypothetical protein [Bradymonadales bacterium]
MPTPLYHLVPLAGLLGQAIQVDHRLLAAALGLLLAAVVAYLVSRGTR